MAKRTASGRRAPFFLSTIFIWLGVAILGSFLILNPGTLNLIRPLIGITEVPLIERALVLRSYMVVSVIMGPSCFVFGILLRRFQSNELAAFSLTALALVLIVMADRLLLLRFPPPIWQGDTELHYRHRPNAAKLYYTNKWIRINSLGLNDEEFPLEKQPGEIRGLLVGNSIAMGFLLDRSENFASFLEKMFQDSLGGTRPYRIINVAVSGYSSYQEYLVLQRSMRFQPDFVMLEYCLNDVTEPFLHDYERQGFGVNYLGIFYFRSPLLMYLLNETGFGRGIIALFGWDKLRGRSNKLSATYSVENLVRHPEAPQLQDGWRRSLQALESIYQLCRQHDLPIYLLVFPYTFQFGHPELKGPQKIVLDHAQRHGILHLDFTEIFDRLVRPPDATEAPGKDDSSAYEQRLQRYYLDADHLAPEGHRVVAAELFLFLRNVGEMSAHPPKEIGISQKP